MATMIPSSDVVNWIIGPVGRCALYIGEETVNAGQLKRAITSLAYQGPFLELGRQHGKSKGLDVTGLDRIISEQQSNSLWAQERINGDHELIHRNGIVALWAYVEVAIEDTAVLVLTKEPASLALLTAAGIKLPTTISLPTMESDARRIYRRLEQHARSGVAVAEGYVQLMAILQISMPLPAKAIETFSEFNYVRNCFLHRGGIVDERAAVEAPTLGLPLGAMIRISSAKYDQYFDAAAELTSALLKAVIESRYIKTK